MLNASCQPCCDSSLTWLMIPLQGMLHFPHCSYSGSPQQEQLCWCPAHARNVTRHTTRHQFSSQNTLNIQSHPHDVCSLSNFGDRFCWRRRKKNSVSTDPLSCFTGPHGHSPSKQDLSTPAVCNPGIVAVNMLHWLYIFKLQYLYSRRGKNDFLVQQGSV